tara:strand:+ start:381 stop:599 length:219 start_codon:yes stop_codon:yes gene_type:complete
MTKLKEYTSVVKLEFSCNNFKANSIKEYKQKVKNSYKREFDIDLQDNEITEIEQFENQHPPLYSNVGIKNND